MANEKKVTWFFKGDNIGWTESYYAVNQSLVSMPSTSDALAQMRVKFLAPGNSIFHERYSDPTVRGAAKVESVPYPGEAIFGNGTPEKWQVGIMCRLQAGDSSRRMLILRGVSDEDVTNGIWSPAGGTKTDLAAFLAALIGRWALRTKTKTGPVIFKTITDAFVERLVIRKTGRPFGLPVGRRRKKKPTPP